MIIKKFNYMKHKMIFLLAVLLSGFRLQGQETYKHSDIRFGIGTSLLGSGDYMMFQYENEYNYRLNKYFTSALSVNFGKSIGGPLEGSVHFWQGNLNLFFSPFKNTKALDIRLGTGLNIYDLSTTYVYTALNGSPEKHYDFSREIDFGANFILEGIYRFSNKYAVGLKLFTQPTFHGNINSGLMLTLGLNL